MPSKNPSSIRAADDPGSRRICARATLAAATAAVLIGTAGPASAAATVYKDEGCETFADGFGFCFDVKSVYNITETKSGNYNLIDNGRFSYQYLQDGVEYYATDGKYHSKFSMKDGESHVSSYHSESSSESGGQTCEYTYKFHMANGEIQKDDFEVVCTPL